MNNLEVIIGIEIHIELNTASKMFSSAPNKFNALPNTQASFVDVGYPGTLPVLNKNAIVKAIKLAKALKMKIDHQLHFDRKNYFYADLPKGFQITQQERPIGAQGVLPIINKRLINIERIHLEEDTARSYHENKVTKLDYNRAGTPLIEIVSYPEIKSAEEAVSYIETIRNTVRILDISDAKMEEGSLRADINLSLRPYGEEILGTKVEIKNLNSLANVAKAIEKEIAHQTSSILKGIKVEQATKRFDETKQDVVTMRVKTDMADYRYYPEPNIPVIGLDPTFVKNITIEELPWEIKDRLKQLNIEDNYIKQLINDPLKMQFINNFSNHDLNQIIKLFFAEVISYANSSKKSLDQLDLKPQEFKEILTLLAQGEISGTQAKKIIKIMLETHDSVKEIIKKYQLKQISDSKLLAEMINNIIISNEAFIGKNKERPERIHKFILGQLMKETKGQANPVIANELMIKLLEV